MTTAHTGVLMTPPKIVLSQSILDTLKASANEPDPTPATPEPAAATPAVPWTPHLSNTQLSMFLRCPAQYRFRYVLGMKERPKVSMSIGKGGHAALEFNTKTKIRTGEDAPVEEVIQKASDMMDHYLSELPPSEIEKDIEPGAAKDKFLAATKIYRVRDAPGITPLGAETEFNLDLSPFVVEEDLPVPLRIINGKIDLIYDDVGTLLSHSEAIRVGITDYKYVAKKKSQNEVDLSTQLTLYGMFMKVLTGKWPTRLGLLLLHSGTVADGPQAIFMPRDPAMMTAEAMQSRANRVIYQFRQMEAALRADYFMPTDNPMTCSWCGFRDRCQNSLATDIPTTNF
jgi:CRISPR/Cas system-associated exonuclease Cas4 (RecB family)